jgi:hypothetical protein
VSPIGRAWLGCIWLAAGATSVSAQGVAETITPDRPGLGDGAHIVGPGVAQLESGIDWAFGKGPGILTFGQALLRYGLGGIELRLQPGSAVVQDEHFGLTDAAIGVKVPLLRGGTRVSAVLSGTVPSGAEVYSGGESFGGATLVAEFGVTPTLGLAINAGYGFPFDDLGDGGYSIIVTPALSFPSRPGLSVYGGYAGYFDHGEDTHFAEAGIAFAPEPDWQFDLNLGRNTENGRIFFGVGVAYRWR